MTYNSSSLVEYSRLHLRIRHSFPPPPPFCSYLLSLSFFYGCFLIRLLGRTPLTKEEMKLFRVHYKRSIWNFCRLQDINWPKWFFPAYLLNSAVYNNTKSIRPSQSFWWIRPSLQWCGVENVCRFGWSRESFLLRRYALKNPTERLIISPIEILADEREMLYPEIFFFCYLSRKIVLR